MTIQSFVSGHAFYGPMHIRFISDVLRGDLISAAREIFH
jgi:hypothetical protein